MKVYCILGIEYVMGTTLVTIPKIYGVYSKKSSAYTARDKINSENQLSIHEINIDN
tara:strand:+ start:2771 stop:2938 length:168 start_codon:yes stop_codon:yes gene_type:complete